MIKLQNEEYDNPLTNPKGPNEWLSRAYVARALAGSVEHLSLPVQRLISYWTCVR